MRRGVGTSPQPRWQRWALPPSCGARAAPAEPPASPPARAEGPAAAPGRQRCKCPALGVPGGMPDCKCWLWGPLRHSHSQHFDLPCWLQDQGPCPAQGDGCQCPGEGRVLCSGTPMPGGGTRAVQLISRSPCRCSFRIQPASVCCGGTSCLSPAWSSLRMTGSSFLLPRMAPSSNASVPFGPPLPVPPA